LPHARIFGTLDELQSAGYADASETDDVSAFSDTKFVGLVVHGARKGKFSGTQDAPAQEIAKVS
jgi:hypothetical protein